MTDLQHIFGITGLPLYFLRYNFMKGFYMLKNGSWQGHLTFFVTILSHETELSCVYQFPRICRQKNKNCSLSSHPVKMDAPIYAFNNNGVPTDPQVLHVYNSMNRAQRARYATLTTDQMRSDFLYFIAQERRKPVCLLKWSTFAVKLSLRLVINVSGGVA